MLHNHVNWAIGEGSVFMIDFPGLDGLTAIPADDMPNLSPKPVDSWSPALAGSIDIRIDAEGNWFHEGAPIRLPCSHPFCVVKKMAPMCL